MVIDDYKCCSRCGQDLPITMFHRDPTKRSGRSSQCRECKSTGAGDPLMRIPPLNRVAVQAFNNWRGAQPGQLQGRAW